jgi:hypothetical protein
MSYSFFGQQSNSTEGAQRKPSDAQVKYYLDLCNTKGVAPSNPHLMTADEIKFKIEDLKSIIKPSDKQLEMINSRLNALTEAGIVVEVAPFLPLTGGQNGSASHLIELLIKVEKENSGLMKPTDAQLRTMVGWYLCPDIPFEDYGIKRRVELDNGWRRPTPDEFAEIIKTSMTKAEASKLIDEMAGKFYTWSSTRITNEQVNYIRSLEERFSNTPKSRVVNSAVDAEGEVFQFTTEKAEKPIKMYNSLDEYQIRMLSKEDAVKFIGMMKAELENKELYKYGEKSDGSESFEPLRHDKHTTAESKESEYVGIQNLVFKLEAVAGYELPDLHAVIDEFVVEHDVTTWTPAKHELRNTMLDLIQTDAITFEGMVKMVEDNQTAKLILLGVGL